MPASDAGFHFIQDYQNCHRYWYNKYVRELEPIQDSPALLFGESGHFALEQYYRDVMDNVPYHERPARAKAEFLAKLHERQDSYREIDKYAEDVVRASCAIDAYCVHYAEDYFQPLAIEESCSMMLPNGQLFTGRIDLVVRTQQGSIFIVDHKYTGWSLSNFEKATRTSNQATAYLMLWNTLHPDQKAQGVIFNIIRAYKTNIDFRRPVVVKTDNDITEFQLDLMSEQGEVLSRLSNPEARWSKNTSHCFAYNRPCAFLELCQGENYASVAGVKFREKNTEQEHR